MKVVILRETKGLGRAGELREVSEGYARNFLIPKKLAAIADPALLGQIEKKSAAEQEKLVALRKNSENFGKKLGKLALEIQASGHDGGKLYAGLKESEILSTIQQVDEHFPENSRLVDYHPIKKSGEYTLLVNLPGGITVETKIIVKSDGKKGKN